MISSKETTKENFPLNTLFYLFIGILQHLYTYIGVPILIEFLLIFSHCYILVNLLQKVFVEKFFKEKRNLILLLRLQFRVIFVRKIQIMTFFYTLFFLLLEQFLHQVVRH